MANTSFSRRGLLKGSLLLLALSSIGRVSTEVFAQTKKKLIDMTGKSPDPKNAAAVKVAKGLNYVDDATAAEKAGKIKRVEKSGVAPAKQICETCQFYKSIEANKSGECMLIQNVLVRSGGYCNSWVKAATYKG